MGVCSGVESGFLGRVLVGAAIADFMMEDICLYMGQAITS